MRVNKESKRIFRNAHGIIGHCQSRHVTLLRNPLLKCENTRRWIKAINHTFLLSALPSVLKPCMTREKSCIPYIRPTCSLPSSKHPFISWVVVSKTGDTELSCLTSFHLTLSLLTLKTGSTNLLLLAITFLSILATTRSEASIPLASFLLSIRYISSFVSLLRIAFIYEALTVRPPQKSNQIQ